MALELYCLPMASLLITTLPKPPAHIGAEPLGGLGGSVWDLLAAHRGALESDLCREAAASSNRPLSLHQSTGESSRS